MFEVECIYDFQFSLVIGSVVFPNTLINDPILIIKNLATAIGFTVFKGSLELIAIRID